MSATASRADAGLDQQQLQLLDAWWRAANYLSVGQIYLSWRRGASTNDGRRARSSTEADNV